MSESLADDGRVGEAFLLLDEAHLVPDWSQRLKAQWDRIRRRKLRVHIIATGLRWYSLCTQPFVW